MNRILIAALMSFAALVAERPCPAAAAPAPGPGPGGAPLYNVEIIVFRASSPGADEDWAPTGAGLCPR
jgi:hypothetical protein